jgi:hypothetical protein
MLQSVSVWIRFMQIKFRTSGEILWTRHEITGSIKDGELVERLNTY